MTILTDARVVQGDQVVEGGWVRWEGERLAEVGPGHLPSTGTARPADGWSSQASSTFTCTVAGAVPAIGHTDAAYDVPTRRWTP